MELVGMEIRKNFQGFGVFTGAVESYDATSGYFRIQYEDGDSEDVDFEEIRSILKEMGGSPPKLEHHTQRRSRGRPPKKKSRLDENSTAKPGTFIDFENGCKKSELDETLVDEREGALRRSARKSLTAAKCENLLLSYDDDLGGGEKESVLVPAIKPGLPPSSNDLELDGLNVFDLFSVYTCLRSFSRQLFLSPFSLETFVAALRCKNAIFLIDSIHFSILQALKPHLDSLSEEGSQTASDCLRYLNWELLDLVTWPVFLVHYLVIKGSEMKPGFRLSQLKLLDSEYYSQPAGVKLEILRCLCDDVIEVDAIRSEINRRMDSEINVDATCINMNIKKKRKSSASIDPSAEEGLEETDDGNIDECCLCGMDGSLICCDGCPAAFHSRCVGVVKDLLPEGEWYCPECSVEKNNGLIELSKPSRGAELLGIDPHGRLYFGSCGRLLVSNSCESDTSYHYYSKNDVGAVITVLKSCYAYSPIVNTISSYCGFLVDASASNNQSGNDIHDDIKEDLEDHVHSEPPLPLKQDVLGDTNAETLEVQISASFEQCGPKSSQVSDFVHLNSVISDELIGTSCPFSCSESFDEKAHAATLIQAFQQTGADRPMGSTASSGQVISLNPNLTAVSEKCSDLPGWGCITDRIKAGASEFQSDPGSYINFYSFGRLSSSISAELMHKSPEDKNNESKKSVEDIKSAQLKAISNKSTKGCCYAYQKLSMDVQKEKCGWCFSCKSSSEFDCLFKLAGNKNMEVSKDKDLDDSKSRTVGPRSEKNKKSHITSAMHHILSIESRARSLLSGPWEKAHYSQHWRKAVIKASDVASLIPLLLTLELNLRRVAFSVEWSKPLDDAHAIVSASIVTSPVRGSSSYSVSRKQRKKNISSDEFGVMSHHAKISDIYWWRGGRLSRQVLQCKMLPRTLASKGGRQAGCKKIPHILYPDSSDVAKRSKYVSWRVAVEMSRSVAQLIYQAKDFDSHIKWAELSDTRFFRMSAKDSKKMAKPVKKVTICGKCNEGKQVRYLLDFGKREIVPAIVIKHGVLLEESTIERKRYWLSEAHVPLNLLKSYEERKMKKKVARLLKKTDLGTHTGKEIKCKIKKRKRPEGLSYLISREQKSEKQLCGHCNKVVLVREAVNCQLCGGFFHRKHFRVPKGVATTTYTCSKCRDTKTMTVKDKGTVSVKSKGKDRETVKEKEDIKVMNVADSDISNVNIQAKGIKRLKIKMKDRENINAVNNDISNVSLQAKGIKRLKIKVKDISMNPADNDLRNVSAHAKGIKSVKAKEDIKSKNAADIDISNMSIQTRGIKSMKAKEKNVKSWSRRDKNIKSMKAEDKCRRSERVKQKEIRSMKIEAQGHETVSKRRKISEGKILETLPEKGKYVLMKSKKKFNVHKKSKQGKSKSGKPEKSENEINWHKRKRSIVHHSFWLNGLQWTHKPVTEQQRDFTERNIILPFQHTEDPTVKPLCCLCYKEYNSGAIYICCERCQDWFHGDAFCLTVENINNLLGFRCHKCRMRSEPVCPFLKDSLIGEAHSDTEYKAGVNAVGNDHQNDEDKHSGDSIVCKEDHWDDEQREDACVKHQEDEDGGHASLHDDCSVTVQNENHLVEMHTESAVGNDHQNDKDKHSEDSVVCKEDHLDDELREDSCVEHQKDEDRGHASLHDDCSVTVQNENHLVEMHRENAVGNDHQNDEDKHSGDSIVCKEDHLDDEQREDSCVEHQKDEDRDHASQHDNCTVTVQNENHLVEMHRENVTEEELGLSSKAVSTNGYIAGLKDGNNLETSHGGACEDCSSIVQSQNLTDEEQKEDVILQEEEPVL